MKSLRLSTLLAFALTGLTGSLQAQRYTITGIAPPVFSNALAINERGQVTGNVYTISANAEIAYGNAYIYFNGHFQGLGTLGSFPGEDNIRTGTSINDHGQVTGSSVAGPWTPLFQDDIHPFLFTAGHMIDLGVRGTGSGINNLGVIVGTVNGFASGRFTDYAFISYNGGPVHALTGLTGNSFGIGINNSNQIIGSDQNGAFIWQNGRVVYLRTAYNRQFVSAYDQIDARAINRFGHVTGDAPLPTPINESAPVAPFIYSNGTFKFLTTDPNLYASGLAINSYDQVVGSGGAGPHALLFKGGQVIDLNDRIPSNSGWVVVVANGINDAGQIVGYGQNGGISAPYQAVLLTPVR
jgi:hypothetical protein